jgi:hypothetical protein
LPSPGSSSNPSGLLGLPLPSYNEDDHENQLAVYNSPSSTGNSNHVALPDIYTVPGARDLTASALVIFFILMLVAQLLGLQRYVRALPRGDLMDAVVRRGAKQIRKYIMNPEADAIPPNIQHAYAVVIAIADAAQQAMASGSQPVFPPQVDLGIPDDEVEDITEQVAPKLKSRLLQGRFGQHSTSSSSNEPLVQHQQPDPLSVRMISPFMVSTTHG